MEKKSLRTMLGSICLVVVLLALTHIGFAAPATPAPKAFELKWSTQWAPGSADAIATQSLGDLIVKRTGSRVKITYFHAETLGKSRDFLDMLDRGVCDIVTVIPSMYPGQFEMAGLFDLPMLGISNRPVAAEVAWELFFAGYLKEYEKFKVLAFAGSDSICMLLRKKKVTTLEDLKGLKIRVPGTFVADLLTTFGASPISIPAGEAFMAMDRGVIDGYVSGSASIIGRKLYEVGAYFIGSPRFNAPVIPMLMNNSKWSSMPPDVQLNVEQAIAEFKYIQLRHYQDADRAVDETMKQHKVEVIELSASEVARLQKAAAPIIDKWVAEKAAKGQPAKEMVELVRKIIGRYTF